MDKWEYKVLKVEKSFFGTKDKEDPAVRLNELGKEGWELVSVIPLESGGSTAGMQLFLKRKDSF